MNSLTALGFALAHSLWQFTAIAALSACLRGRYAPITLALVPLTFGATVLHLLSQPDTPARIAIPEHPWAPTAAILWLAGAALMSLRAVGGWLLLQRRIRQSTPLLHARWQDLCRRAGVGNNVSLRLSRSAESPYTAGWLRPVVIIPAAAWTTLPPDYLEAILLHELAHIRRNDYLTALLQSAVEALFFYHPALWWMSHTIRKEREHACDDAAIDAGPMPRTVYARALLSLEELRAVTSPAQAASAHHLAERIHRIMEPQTPQRTPLLPLLLLGLTALPFLTAQVPDGPYRKWLNEDVAYIIESREKTRFEELKSDAERAQFVSQFWQRRGEQAKREHYRRIAYANERFSSQSSAGWKSERGRHYIVSGPPDEIETRPRGRNIEVWRYRTKDGAPKDYTFQLP